MSVLVYIENWDGKFKKLSFELVSFASETAKMMNSTVTALSIGKVDESELKKLGDYGAGKVMTIENDLPASLDNQAYSYAISEVAHRIGSTVIILSNNNSGKAIAPGLSVRLKAGVGSGVSRLPLSIDPFIVYKRTYSGNAFAKVEIRSGIKILTLAQNTFHLTETTNNAVIEKIEIPVDGDTGQNKSPGY